MIDFENVSKTYPNGTNALHNVTLHIDKGEFVFIVGASGAGKSTFLKLIMREETPTSGEITINGNKLSTLKKRHVPYLRRHMGVVYQDFRLIDKMNVFDNVAFAMRAVGESAATVKKRVPYVLDLVGLKDKMKCKPSELSGGEQQRVSLARALVNNPEIIVADEPTGNIDPELSHEIIDLLTRINSMGTTVLVVTHEHELVREFNQRVIALAKGEIMGDTATMVISHEEPAPEEAIPEAPAPEEAIPEAPVPDAIPGETAAEAPVPDETRSDEIVPEEILPEEGIAAEEAVPSDAAFEERGFDDAAEEPVPPAAQEDETALPATSGAQPPAVPYDDGEEDGFGYSDRVFETVYVDDNEEYPSVAMPRYPGDEAETPD